MSGSLLAIIFIPVVVAIALGIWIFAVYHASRQARREAGRPAGL
jgi:hypothetical protein